MSEHSGELRQKSHFGEKQLQANPDAPILDFRPLPLAEGETVPRDRFGNRIFTSPEKSYRDRGDKENKAALLVSRDGEEFMRNNPGILQDIDRGLQSLTVEEKRGSINSSLNEIDLGNDRVMKRLTTGETEGSQSIVFLMQTKSGKYAVKVAKYIPVTQIPVSQPYFNEMLALALDLKDTLAGQDTALSTFLFASGQVSCTEFVEGESPTREEWAPRLRVIESKIKQYLKAQEQKGSNLWAGTSIDFYQEDTRLYSDYYPVLLLRTDNVIKRPNGKFVLIDYISVDEAYVLKHLSNDELAERKRELMY